MWDALDHLLRATAAFDRWQHSPLCPGIQGIIDQIRNQTRADEMDADEGTYYTPGRFFAIKVEQYLESRSADPHTSAIGALSLQTTEQRERRYDRARSRAAIHSSRAAHTPTDRESTQRLVRNLQQHVDEQFATLTDICQKLASSLASFHRHVRRRDHPLAPLLPVTSVAGQFVDPYYTGIVDTPARQLNPNAPPFVPNSTRVPDELPVTFEDVRAQVTLDSALDILRHAVIGLKLKISPVDDDLFDLYLFDNGCFEVISRATNECRVLVASRGNALVVIEREQCI